jgi:hypothetical protein
VLTKLGPLDPAAITDLRPYLETVPDPRSRRGRWYSLTTILLVCACAALSGAKSIDELAEWGQRAETALLETIGIRSHLLKWRRSPSTSTIDRVLTRLDGDALDAAVGAYLADRHQSQTHNGNQDDPPLPGARRRLAIAVDGKALKGSARLDLKRRHLLSAVTHGVVVTLAQAEVGAKTNETKHFQPLLAPLDLAGAVVTFDALHSVKGNITWLVEEKKAHYIAVIKTNQPIAHTQISALPWNTIGVQHTRSETGHGRVESRSIKTMAICDELGGIAFPTPSSPSASTAAASSLGRKKLVERTTPSPASTHTSPARPNSPNCVAANGVSRIPPTTSAMSPSPRTPRPSTTAPRHAPWPRSATSPSAPSRSSEPTTSPRPPGQSKPNPNEPYRS